MSETVTSQLGQIKPQVSAWLGSATGKSLDLRLSFLGGELTL